MSRRVLLGTAAAVLVALGALYWWTRPPGPRMVAEGQALPFGRKVEMRFVDKDTGKTETWKLQKKRTTREEVVKERPLPQPDPDAASHEPDESARALDGMALEAWKGGDLAKATKLFEQAVAADPEDAVPRSHYGRLLTLMNDYEHALPQLERAAELSPDDPQVWLDLQTVYERTLHLAQAIEARKRAVALAGGRAIHQNPMGYYEIEGAPSFP